MGNDHLPIQFEQAKPHDAALLTKTTFQSKKMWHYTDVQMSLWADELIITETYILENKVFKIIGDKSYIGFFSLIIKGKLIEIDHFWLLPENTGMGYGKKTFNFIKEMARTWGYDTIEVYAEPNANGFYAKLGGKIIRVKESKIEGRFLNVYEFKT